MAGEIAAIGDVVGGFARQRVALHCSIYYSVLTEQYGFETAHRGLGIPTSPLIKTSG